MWPEKFRSGLKFVLHFLVLGTVVGEKNKKQITGDCDWAVHPDYFLKFEEIKKKFRIG